MKKILISLITCTSISLMGMSNQNKQVIPMPTPKYTQNDVNSMFKTVEIQNASNTEFTVNPAASLRTINAAPQAHRMGTHSARRLQCPNIKCTCPCPPAGLENRRCKPCSAECVCCCPCNTMLYGMSLGISALHVAYNIILCPLIPCYVGCANCVCSDTEPVSVCDKDLYCGATEDCLVALNSVVTDCCTEEI